MSEETNNMYLQLAGKIGTSSVFLGVGILIFGGSGAFAIAGVAILCGFGVLLALLNRSRSCACCDESKESKPSPKKATKKKAKK